MRTSARRRCCPIRRLAIVAHAAALPRTALAACLLASSVASAAEPPSPAPDKPSAIALYVRDPGSPAAQGAIKYSNLKQIDLDKVKLDDAIRVDVQYDSSIRYRGLPLVALINLYSPPIGTDLAILHFDNGVAIPMPFRDEHQMKRVDAFVARAIQTDAAASFSDAFPPLARKVDNFVDVRPVSFSGNKVAASTRYHPMVPEHDTAVFSPWIVAGSLRTIEFVQQAAYHRQIEIEGASREVRSGLSVFTRACQFCHGVGGMGASFGVDFLEPEPIVTRKATPRALFFHVLLRDKAPASTGTQMPALRHLTEDDARDLHRWLQAIVQRPLRPYKP